MRMAPSSSVEPSSYHDDLAYPFDFLASDRCSSMTTLVVPARPGLDGFVAALAAGWSPDASRGPEAAAEELAAVQADPDAYLASQVDREARRGPVKLPDGSLAPRLPGCRIWIWDGAFCGTIGLRWQPGTTDLPPYCLGHVGYAVVPWKRRQGHATRALALMLPCARDEGLPFVIITTDVANVASQRVIERNGGVLVETFDKPASSGGGRSRRYRIDLECVRADAMP